jgi:hypothetical protein
MTLVTPTALHDAQGNLKPLVTCEPDTPPERKPCGTLYYSPNYLGNLMVVERRNLVGSTAEFVLLSADGRRWIDGWHYAQHGPECGETVYVEKHTTGGAVFHGWVDKASRRVVQAG